MKKVILGAFVVGVVGMFASACSVGVGDGDGGGCDAISCTDALTSGLSTQGGAICDADSDNAYTDVFNCGCSGGPCADVCSDNLCADLGESSDCGDCLDQNCSAEETECANN